MVRASVLSVLAFGLLTSSALAAPAVNVMPGTATDAKQYRPGTLTTWGNANGGDGTAIGFNYEFTFDFNPACSITDDGSLSGVVTDDKFISEVVTVGFLGGATRCNVVGHLTVTDPGDSSSDTDTFILDIVGPTDPISATPEQALLIDVNNAINNGLRALYLMQQANGSWAYYEDAGIGVTGFAVWAFENQGYFAKDDPTRDIYAEFIGKGIDWLAGASGKLSVFNPAVQPAGNPDSDGNLRCVQLQSFTNTEGYASPIATAALVSALDNARPITSGPLAGEPLKNLIQDACDWVVFAQNDVGTGQFRGTWRYTANSGSGDKSADSWNYVSLEGGETVSLVIVPDFVKTEAEYGIIYDQNADGRFGYTGTTPIGDGVGHATTGAGVAGLAFLVTGGHVPDYAGKGAPAALDTQAEKLDAALAYLGSVWGSGGPPAFLQGNRGNHYAMWTITRALRLNGIDMLINGGNPFDWELNLTAADAPTEGYFPFLVRTQFAPSTDGSWDSGDGWYNREFDTATALLILSPFVFASACEPVTINFDIDNDGRAIATQSVVDDTYIAAGLHMEGKSGETGHIGTYATNPALDPSTDDLFATSPPNVVNTRPSADRTDSDWGTITFFFQDPDGSVRSAAQVSVDFLDVEDSGFGGGGRNATKLQAFDSSDVLVGEVDVPVGANGNVFHAEIGAPDSSLFIAKVVVTLGDRDDSAAMDTFQYCLNPPTLEAALYPSDGQNVIEAEPFTPINEFFNIGLKSSGGEEQFEGTSDFNVKITAKVKGRARVFTLGQFNVHTDGTPRDLGRVFHFVGPVLKHPENYNGREIETAVTVRAISTAQIVSHDAKKLKVQSQ